MTDDETERLAKELGLGAEGTYTHGKVDETDEGDLKAALTIKNGKVLLLFGKKLSWVAMTRDQALGLSELLRARALQLPAT